METLEGGWELIRVFNQKQGFGQSSSYRAAHRQPEKGAIGTEVVVILENPFLCSCHRAPGWQKAIKYLAGTYN